jgi:hypothetical protein
MRRISRNPLEDMGIDTAYRAIQDLESRAWIAASQHRLEDLPKAERGIGWPAIRFAAHSLIMEMPLDLSK